MLVPLGFANTRSGSCSTLPDSTEKECQRLGNQPDGRGLCRNRVPAAGAWSGHPQKREHEDHRTTAGGHECARESPVSESGGAERSKALQRAAQRRKRRRTPGPWGKSRDDANDPDRADNGGLLGLHNVSPGEKVQSLGPQKACRPATARRLFGIGAKVSSRIGRGSTTAGRDLRCGDRRNAVMKRLLAAMAPRWQRVMEGVSMMFMTNVRSGVFFVAFSYWLVIARTRRQVLAAALAGVLVVALVGPPQAKAQGSLVVAIQSVLNVINGLIKTALNSINSVRTAISNFYQQATWPVALINQAKATVTQMIGQYRSAMQNIFTINLKSATLPNPVGLENAMRNHQTNDFPALTSSFGITYGGVPTTTEASPADRTMMDMDDALAVDNLKTLKESDAAGDLTLQAADNIENAASQAAPGSAPFLTATAVVASIESQALTQKMLAAELRQEAARLAHENALRKRGTTMTGDVNTQILNLLQRK